MDLISLVAGIESMKIDSRYRLVIVTAQRARQLMQGSKPKISSVFKKETTVGLQETLQGKTEYLKGAEARAALREARQKESMMRTQSLLSETGDANEIKKDLNRLINNSVAEKALVEKKDD